MSKLIIEQALQHAIAVNNLHLTTLQGGNVNLFIVTLARQIPYCHSRVLFPNMFGRNVRIHNITYTNNQYTNVDWAQQANHFSPHQYVNLQTYLNYSLQDPLLNVLKLADCGFAKFYILQLQSHITGFRLYPGATYSQLHGANAFFNYLGNTMSAATANINRIIAQNRIQELEINSRNLLDSNLIYGQSNNTMMGPFADIDVSIHYLISGPFNSASLKAQLGLNGPYEDLVDGQQTTIWDLDVSIESDPKG
jgi:hypothetical protein